MRYFLVLLLMSLHCTQANHSKVNGHLIATSFLEAQGLIANSPVMEVLNFERSLVKLLSSYLNFTFEIRLPTDTVGSGVNRQGSWTGSMGQIQRKEVGICFSPMPISASRYRIADFSYPVRQDSTAILIPFPEQQHKLSLLASPFKLSVWLCLMCGYMLTVFTFWLLGYESQGRSWVSLHYWAFYLCRAALGQETYTPERSCRWRTFCGLIFLTAVVILNAYSAVFTSMQTAPRYQKMIESIADVAQRDDLAVYVVKGTSTEEDVMSSTSPIMKSIQEKWRRHPEYKIKLKMYEITDLVNENSVLFMPKLLADAIVQLEFKKRNKCVITVAQNTFLPQHLSMIFPKDSNLTATFTKAIMYLQDTGILEYIKRRTELPPSPCSISTGAEHRPLTMEDLSGGFMILAVGLGLALIALAAEKIHYKYRH